MAVDLHLHSSVSDGTDDPTDLVALAAAARLEAIALTDHDTLDGIAEASEAAHRHGIRFVPGIELSVDHGNHKLHLLVYFTTPGPGPLNDRLDQLLAGRHDRNEVIVRRLRDLGYEITMEDVLAHAHGPSVGRPHIADALVDAGHFPSRDRVFEHLLHDGGPAYVERDRLGAIEAIQLAREQDGVAVIAHPVTIGSSAEESASLFTELAAAGLGGIEAHHPRHPIPLRHHLADLAASLGIAATGGSDYHGRGARSYRIGTGNGDLSVPGSALEQLEAQRR